MEASDREIAMRNIPLSTLLRYPAVFLAPLLRDAGSSEPLESKLCNGATIPKIFPLT